MKTILLPIDFTESTTYALNWARLFAHHYDATLILLHVQLMVISDDVVPVMGGFGMGIPTDAEPASHDQLNALAVELRAEGIACQTDLRRGAVTDAILSAAQDHNTDLIITGHKHITNFFGRFGSSAATGVARGAHCPVLVVPTGDSESPVQPARIQSVVFTTSLEFDQDEEFGQVVGLARSFGATVRVLHVRAENQPNLNDDMEMLGQLQEVYGTDLLLSHSVASRTVSGGIETYLATSHPDLLVMTTRERDFLSGLLNPSLTGRMMTLANLPILVYQVKVDM